jgi:conjugal transfer mating pair stabilization protein TraN
MAMTMTMKKAFAAVLAFGLSAGIAVADPPADPPAGGFDPFNMPENFDPNQYMTIEDHEEGAANYVGGPIPIDSFKLFDGKTMACMRALGGLLNCCTKQPPPSAEPEKTFWELLTEQLRERYANVAACRYNGVTADDPAVQGAWSQIGQVPGNLALNNAFSSSIETLQGGGDLPECKDQSAARQETVTAEYLKQMRPKLAWFCDRDEKDLGALKKIGNCRFLGTYCQTRVLGVCIARRERYCCFNSPMSRMMRETLAQQGIGGFGTAKNPSCGGITITQLAALQSGEGIDTDDIEGRIIESGQFDELRSLMGQDLINRISGEENNINNPGRVDAQQRTLNYVSGMNTSGQLGAQSNELMGLVAPPQELERSAGSISLRASGLYLHRGERGMDLIVSRDGGKGAVSVDVVLVNGTALLHRDMTHQGRSEATVTVTWGDGQTGERRVRVRGLDTAPPAPAIRETRFFKVELHNPTNGAKTITDFIDVEVRPETR